MTLQEVIDGEIARGVLSPEKVHLTDLDPRRGLMHHEWCWVREIGMSTKDKQLAVVMAVEFSPITIHVQGTQRLLCKFDDLHKHNLEFVDWLEDA